MNRKIIGIACVDPENGIGYNRNLLIHDRQDLKHFKELTTNKVVVMGGETFRSLPNAHSLPNRTNVILSRSIPEIESNMIICTDLSILYNTLHILKRNSDIFIIGGQSLYNEFKYIYDELYITHVDYNFPFKDKYFPDILNDFRFNENIDRWSGTIADNGDTYNMSLVHYIR